jgi:acetate kinase
MKVARMQKNISKENEIIKTTFKNMIKKSKINFIVHNLPQTGERVIDGGEERITARSISDTMKQIGKVDDAVVFKNTAYIWFTNTKDAERAHSLINNKCMGNSIIKTEIF